MGKKRLKIGLWMLVVAGVAAGVLAYVQFRRPPVPPVTEVVVDEAQPLEELPEPVFDEADWPAWRGTARDGVQSDVSPPLEWGQDVIAWRSEVPGRGHGSPIIVSKRIYLPTADEATQQQSLLAYDLETGNQLWHTTVHQGGLDPNVHDKNTQASSTPASDGELLFAAFLHKGSIWVSALDLKGELKWQREIGGFASKFGYAASPVVDGSLVIVAADHQDGGFLAALHRKTGDIVWRKRRPVAASYATPTVVHAGGRDQLLICGGRQVDSYDPETGEPIWSVKGTAEACVGSLVSDGDLVFASGGYPERETIAIEAETGNIVWRADTKSYVPSLVAHDGLVFQIQDDGILRCFHAADGKEAWKKRLGGRFSASPVLAGGAVFVCDEAGKVTVFEATSEKYQQLAQNLLGEEIMASPAISGKRLVLRVAEGTGEERTEYLYCLASKPAESSEPTTEATD